MMNGATLRETLTKANLGQGSPLFKNCADLADQVCKVTQASEPGRRKSSTATVLSNVFSGRRYCSAKLQKDIIASVRSRVSSSPENVQLYILAAVNQSIEQHNQKVSDSSSNRQELAEASIFFQRLSRPGAMLLVQYGDMPRTAPESKYPGFAEKAGEAVSNGLSFAMVQPFCNDIRKLKNQLFFHTLVVRNYLAILVRRTREVYFSMLRSALEHRGDQDPEEIAKRLVLYEFVPHVKVPSKDRITTAGDLIFSSSTVQSRIFLAEIPVGDKVERELWEWVAGMGHDYFIHRDDASIPPNVISEQFFFITKFWTVHHRLPSTTAEVEETIGAWGPQLEACLPVKLWKVFASPKEALRIVKEQFPDTRI